MASCNTQTCVGFSADVLGAGTQIHGLQTWWVKNNVGVNFSWPIFSDDSQKFGGNAWIGIQYASGMSQSTKVADVRIFDCNGFVVAWKGLFIPTGMSWKKWTFTAGFTSDCSWSVKDNTWGTGTMPPTPPSP